MATLAFSTTMIFEPDGRISFEPATARGNTRLVVIDEAPASNWHNHSTPDPRRRGVNRTRGKGGRCWGNKNRGR